ncbi:MAG: hypothetical protein QM669_15745 [Siphonobacter sp.]
MKQPLPYLLFCFLCLLSCTKDHDYTVVYLIKAGNNYSQQEGLSILNKSSISAAVTFNESAIYTTVDPINQGDINKLIGFSDCNSLHQQNSARFGWNWQNNQLHIYAYCYVNGVRNSQELGTAELGKAYEYKVEVKEDHYLFTFNGQEFTMSRGCTQTTGLIHYRLYPYFGGDEPAPHDITIQVEEH